MKNMQGDNLIYSRNSYKSILQKCCTFVGYCKEYFEVRQLSEIKPEYFIQFIKSGNEGAGYNKQTANAYKSAVTKLQDGYNAKFEAECAWVDEIKEIELPSVKSKLQMPREIHDEIISRAYESKYETGLAFDIARSLGLRVSEITNLRMNDFWFDKHGKLTTIYIHGSKGGRHRKIQSVHLTNQQVKNALKVYEHFKNIRGNYDRMFANKSGSYQRAFERIRDSISEDYKYCGFHSMRKEFAKDFYNREEGKGRNIREVKRALTQLLGHNRLEILKNYL
ncbi:tyrosine-type recombinase/integrase [Sporomusa ovata]|nr:site-specific integrase [Sporomusa ovata]